jgi:hypothetical protein
MKAAAGDDVAQAADLMADYVAYCADSSHHPAIWPANATAIYNWWLNRSTAQVTASYGITNGTHSLATITISGAQDANTAVEVLAQGFGSVAVSLLRTNGVVTTNNYRTVGEMVKVLVGAAVTNVEVEYFPGPVARNDFYTAIEGQALNVSAAAGVLSNDWSGSWPGLSAVLNGGPSYGTLTLNSDGSFTYTPTNGFWGTDCFSYEATDRVNNFGTATVTFLVAPTSNCLFSDDFRRCMGTALNPWQVYSGTWSLGGGSMQGSSTLNSYGFCFFSTNWTSYSVEAMVQFQSNAYGGGLGACLDPLLSGKHYAAWIYPDNSQGGTNMLKLVKFSGWNSFGYDGTDYAPMAETNLPPVGTGWHLLRLACSNNVLEVDYDGIALIRMQDADTDQPIYSSGGVSLDMWTHPAGGVYTMSVSNLIVSPVP